MHDHTLGNQRTLSHGSSPWPPTAVTGTVIGARYEVVRFLGRGGMGEVFLCRDTKLGREVAVKRILNGGAQQPTLIERFRREAKAVAQLSHVNIVTLFDFDVDEHGPFLVMELLRGQDLASHVKAHGPMPSATVKQIALQLVSALQHAHAQGLVHRDIKPSNVFLQTNGSVKLLDFGIVRAADSAGLSQTNVGLGTTDYVAPEQAADASAADERSDQYALAGTLTYLLLGMAPRLGLERSLPSDWKEVLLCMLDPDPSQRFDHMDDVAQVLVHPPVESAVVVERPKQPEPSPVSRPVANLDWAVVLDSQPDPVAVPDPEHRKAIIASGLPWRVTHRCSEIELLLVPAGSFLMGASMEDHEASAAERPQRRVSLRQPVYLGRYPVTYREWARAQPRRVSVPQAEWLLPVNKVRLAAALGFVEGYGDLRLPTEVEWEFACRAGTTGSRYGILHEIAWYEKNCSDWKSIFFSGTQVKPVGRKRPNGLAFHDMLGNVWEWCRLDGEQSNGTPETLPLRGGAHYSTGGFVRASARIMMRRDANANNGVGLRVARDPYYVNGAS